MQKTSGARKQTKVLMLRKIRLYSLKSLYTQMLMCLLISNVIADEGRLLDPYPPNVQAENFKLFDISGDKHELKDFHGKFVLVNFWAMSCNVCKSEMTTLQSAYELLDSEKLIIVSIHAGDDIEGVQSVVKLNKITYPVLVDIDLKLGSWGVPILPTSFIVGPDGNIRYRAVGTRVWNSPFMIDFLQSLLDSYELKLSKFEHAIH